MESLSKPGATVNLFCIFFEHNPRPSKSHYKWLFLNWFHILIYPTTRKLQMVFLN